MNIAPVALVLMGLLVAAGGPSDRRKPAPSPQKPEMLEPMAPYLDLSYCDGYERARTDINARIEGLRAELGEGASTEMLARRLHLGPCPRMAIMPRD